MNRLKKKVFCVLLSTIMFFCSSGIGVLASASDINDANKLTSEKDATDRIDGVIEYGGDMISIEEEDSVIRISVRDEATGQENYFVSNPREQTVYSSYTGKTVDVSDVEIEEIKADIDSDGIVLYSDSGYVGDVTSKISYNKLSSMIGDVAGATVTVAAIAEAVLAILAARGKNVSSKQSLTDLVRTVGEAVKKALPKGSKKHGIELTLKKYKHVRYRAGKRLVRISYKPKSIARY